MSLAHSDELDDFFSDQWRDLKAACCNPAFLDQDDMHYISVNDTWIDLQNQILHGSPNGPDMMYHPEITMLSRNMKHIKVFIDAIETEIGQRVSFSVFWGFSSLVIKLAQEEEGALSRIPRILRQICRKTEILNSYCIAKVKIVPPMKEACFEIALRLFAFLSSIVTFVRRDHQYSLHGESDWQPLQAQASSLLQDLDESISSIEKISRSSQHVPELEQLRELVAGLSPQLDVGEQAKLPCHIFPTFRVAKFFDRSETIVEMDRFFDKHKSEGAFQSLALWGLGGVGKSSVALRYVETKIREGHLDAMFWIRSEKEVTIRQSFTDIATQLKLPGASTADHSENKTLVLDWLQHTKCRWLLVYDNVDDTDILMSYWPAATRGQALITSRRSDLAFDPASGGLEVTSWDADKGSQFLLHLLSTDITEQLSKEDTRSVDELSEKLSGHALAISQFAGLIQRRRWSISEFVLYYNQQPDKIHGIFGSKSINTLWDISFRSLDPRSRTILGVICYLEPDQIPEAVFDFVSSEGDQLPARLEFTQDPFDLSAVVEDLLTSALIKRDSDRKSLTVHRLVQDAFRHFMSVDERQQSFDDATLFLWTSFPKKNETSQDLYSFWTTCAMWLPHVLTMMDRFQQEVNANPRFTVLTQYIRLNNDVSRYCFETNSLENMLQLTTVNFAALAHRDPLRTVPHHQTIFAEGGHASYTGQLYCIIGRSAEGAHYLRKSYDLMCKDEPWNPQEECFAAINYAHGLGSMNAMQEAEEWAERALEHWFQYCPEDRKTGNTLPATNLSLGLTLLFKGDLVRARQALLEGRSSCEKAQPFLWQLAARIDFALGTLERRERNLETSEALYMDAQNNWRSNSEIRTEPFNGAIMYKLGCVSLDQGKVEAAEKHFRDALQITTLHRDLLKAEHARCLFKLSETLWQTTKHEEEAEQLRNDAERLLREAGGKTANPGLEKSYDDLINLYWR